MITLWNLSTDVSVNCKFNSLQNSGYGHESVKGKPEHLEFPQALALNSHWVAKVRLATRLTRTTPSGRTLFSGMQPIIYLTYKKNLPHVVAAPLRRTNAASYLNLISSVYKITTFSFFFVAVTLDGLYFKRAIFSGSHIQFEF